MYSHSRQASCFAHQKPFVQPVRTRNQITNSSHASIWQIEDTHTDLAANPCGGGSCGCWRKTPLRKSPE